MSTTNMRLLRLNEEASSSVSTWVGKICSKACLKRSLRQQYSLPWLVRFFFFAGAAAGAGAAFFAAILANDLNMSCCCVLSLLLLVVIAEAWLWCRNGDGVWGDGMNLGVLQATSSAAVASPVLDVELERCMNCDAAPTELERNPDGNAMPHLQGNKRPHRFGLHACLDMCMPVRLNGGRNPGAV